MIKKSCFRNGKWVAAGRSTMTVAYGRNGLLERAKSDLDGDGKADRRKKR